MERSRVFSLSGTTPSSASTAVVNTIHGLAAFDAITIVLEVVGATGGTLDLILESNWGTDTVWYSFYRVAQLADGAAAAIYKVTCSLQNTVTTIGKNQATTLAAGTVAAGHWGDSMRLVAIAGASTSAGAAIVAKVIGHRILR